MSDYSSVKTQKGQFDPSSKEAFVVSRTKVDTFMECRRCSYLDLRFGVKRVQGPAFTLNNAVDGLLKREFDVHRANGTAHPMMQAYGIEAVPFQHEKLEEWRDSLRRGVKHFHEPANLILRGGIDDVWQNSKGELHVVDYKATAKKQGPSQTDDLYGSYKRQVEVYQWLFRRNNFPVSRTAYFVYVNGRADARAFDGKLEFDVAVIPYEGDDSWVEQALHDLKAMLMEDKLPEVGTAFNGGPCEYCTYRKDAQTALSVFPNARPVEG